MSTPTAYFEKRFVPLSEAKLGVMTHAFNYGTAVFEGVRGNWSEAHGELYLFKLREHVRRIRQSAKIMRLGIALDEDEMVEVITDLVRRNEYREDVYVRPIIYKSSQQIGLRVHNLDDDFLVYVAPFGAYLDPDAGVRCMTSSWRRIDDTMIPARAKVTGLYVNNALAKTEAQLSGFDEAILLNADGHVSEGSGENIVLLRDGRLVSPPPQDNILEGITLDTALQLAREEFGLEVERRTVDRSELYIADEIFMTGTAAHVTPVTEVDRLPIGDGRPGTISVELQRRYFAAITGELAHYRDWLTPIYSGAAVGAQG
ncbi:MAG: branched-chain amino acid transaminase [Chloroflexi bacterium]|nr:branched-chain amino acid transaminase [Chloroflexota bacterium]